MKHNRRRWPRIPLPDALYWTLLALARANGYNERQLYVFLYRMMKECHSEEEIEKAAGHNEIDWIANEPKQADD